MRYGVLPHRPRANGGLQQGRRCTDSSFMRMCVCMRSSAVASTPRGVCPRQRMAYRLHRRTRIGSATRRRWFSWPRRPTRSSKSRARHRNGRALRVSRRSSPAALWGGHATWRRQWSQCSARRRRRGAFRRRHPRRRSRTWHGGSCRGPALWLARRQPSRTSSAEARRQSSDLRHHHRRLHLARAG